MLEFLKDFLTHEDPNVRAKACSVLGNMCRHSSYFYSSLVSLLNLIPRYQILVRFKISIGPCYLCAHMPMPGQMMKIWQA